MRTDFVFFPLLYYPLNFYLFFCFCVFFFVQRMRSFVSHKVTKHGAVHLLFCTVNFHPIFQRYRYKKICVFESKMWIVSKGVKHCP